MLSKFKYRSYKTELLDLPNIPKEILYTNLYELDLLNRTFGGHSITLQGIKQLVTDKNQTYHIVDLGCGSGDALKYIANWAKSNNFKVHLTGVDKNINAINYLNEHCKDYPNIVGVVSDYHDFLKMANTIDIIHCSLFCHHLKDDELLELLSIMKRNARRGFIINDLHRNWFAYYSVRYLTRLFNGSSLSKNDGPISVLRAFTSKELNSLLQKAQITNYTINWKWAFRYLVVGKM